MTRRFAVTALAAREELQFPHDRSRPSGLALPVLCCAARSASQPVARTGQACDAPVTCKPPSSILGPRSLGNLGDCESHYRNSEARGPRYMTPIHLGRDRLRLMASPLGLVFQICACS